MKPGTSRRQPKVAEVLDEAAEEGERPHAPSLHETAQRLHPNVNWDRMSEEAVRDHLGLRASHCSQREEYEAGRRARSQGEVPGAEASMAFRTGWTHGNPPRPRRRRWKTRPHSSGRQEGGEA